MDQWKCSVCGYVHEGENPPEHCPVCHAPAEKFFRLEKEAEPDGKAEQAAAPAAEGPELRYDPALCEGRPGMPLYGCDS